VQLAFSLVYLHSLRDRERERERGRERGRERERERARESERESERGIERGESCTRGIHRGKVSSLYETSVKRASEKLNLVPRKEENAGDQVCRCR
jgi:hypothetical protein